MSNRSSKNRSAKRRTSDNPTFRTNPALFQGGARRVLRANGTFEKVRNERREEIIRLKLEAKKGARVEDKK
jgi:hypothetical protein